MEGKSAAAPFDGDAGIAPARMACPWSAVVRGRGEGTKKEDVCSVERAGPSEFSGAADKCSGLAEAFAVAGASFLLVISTATDSAVWNRAGTASWLAAALFKAGQDTPLCTLSATSASTGWGDAGFEATSDLDHEGVPPGSQRLPGARGGGDRWVNSAMELKNSGVGEPAERGPLAKDSSEYCFVEDPEKLRGGVPVKSRAFWDGVWFGSLANGFRGLATL